MIVGKYGTPAWAGARPSSFGFLRKGGLSLKAGWIYFSCVIPCSLLEDVLPCALDSGGAWGGSESAPREEAGGSNYFILGWVPNVGEGKW